MSPRPRNTPTPACLPKGCTALPGSPWLRPGWGAETAARLGCGGGAVVLPGQMSVFAFLANVLVEPAQWP